MVRMPILSVEAACLSLLAMLGAARCNRPPRW
jgi:hypothetical protein